MKVIIYAIVALLAVESFAHGLEVRAPVLVVRQETESATAEQITSTSVLSKAPPTPAVPTPAAPTDVVDTVLSKSPSPSGASGAPSAYAPTGTGSLIPSWSALVAKGVPSGQPTAPPSPPASTGVASAPSSGHKIEIGLVGSGLIAGIVSLFF